MRVFGYSPKSEHVVHVPSYAVAEDGTTHIGPGKDPEESDPVVLNFSFELEEGKWFAIDGETVVRFPASREWEWRARRAEQVVRGLSGSPEERLASLRCAARLVGVDILSLKKRLEEARESGEDLSATFRRLSRKQ